MSKTILITGGAGSIGYHVINEILCLTDWDIVVLDSFRHRGYHERIQYILDNVEGAEDRLIVIQHDLVCPISKSLKKEIGPVNYILHLAAISDVFWAQENPRYTLYNNVESTATMVEYAEETDHEAFIYFSTDEVYGPVKPGEAHPEWDTHRPSNTYSATKAMGEDWCYQAWRRGGLKLILTNTMNNFGPFQSDAKFPVKVQRALEKGEKVVIHGNKDKIGSRFYIHSKRVARTLIDILKEMPPTLHKTGFIDEPDRYHIISKTCLDNLELAQAIAGMMGKELDYELIDFHKDNPEHDSDYGLENNKLDIEDDFYGDMLETIEFQKENE